MNQKKGMNPDDVVTKQVLKDTNAGIVSECGGEVSGNMRAYLSSLGDVHYQMGFYEGYRQALREVRALLDSMDEDGG